MKKLFIILLSLSMLFSATACSGGGNGGSKLEGTYDVTIWVSEVEGVKDLFQKQIKEFCDANEGITINATIEGVTESNAATLVLADVESAPDMYCFAQDQLARLVQAGALQVAGAKASEEVKNTHSEATVSCATFNDQIYGYPLTGDNGYFMFYDKSVVKEEHLDSLEDIIADCEAANKQISFELENSWYTAGFFIGTGCVNEWSTDSDGNWSAVNDTYNSPAGLVAMKGIQKVVKSSAYVNSSAGQDAAGSAVIVSGTWATSTIKDIWGENFGATDLPSFTVDGQTYHIGSFSGIKMMGIKPQTDPNKAAVLQQLALYLTGEKCAKERFEQFAWGPSVKALQESEAVKNDVALSAFYKQSEFAVPQGDIHGSWWGIANNLGASAKAATSDADLEKALADYETAVNGLIGLEGYVFVGQWNGWNNADEALKMTKEGENYTITIDVPELDFMGGRVVSMGNWDTDKGFAQVVEGADLLNADSAGDDNNMVFNAAGNYTVTYNATTGEITVTKN